MSETRRVETSTGCVFLRDDGILEVSFNEGVNLVLDDSKEIVEACRQLAGEKAPLPALIDVAGVRGQTSEGREHFARSDEAVEAASKVALLTESLVARVLANSYMTFKRPPVPTRLFNSRDEALAWLKEPGG